MIAVFIAIFLSDISIPFSKLLPNNRFIEIDLGDPRGNIIRRITLSLLFSLKLRKKISFINPDIIYPVNPDMLGLSFLSNLFLRKKKLVYDFQDQKGEDLNFIYKSLYKISALNVSTVFIRSEGFIDHIRSNNLFKKNVIIKYFAEAPLGWELFEKKYTSNNFINPLVVGYFGNIRGKKEIESLIDAVKIVNDEGKNIQSLSVYLKYNNGSPVIKEINRVSKPGRRIYAKASSIPRIKNGLGLAIVSTSKGIMTDNEARNNKIGGEIICKVF